MSALTKYNHIEILLQILGDPWLRAWAIKLSEMDEWTEQAQLNSARYQHACGVLTDDGSSKLIVSVGGIDYYANEVDFVELLLVTEDIDFFADHWTFGPALPDRLKNAASVTTSDQRALFIIGGTRFDGAESQKVYKLFCSAVESKQCSWTKVDYELKIPTTMGLALAFPSLPMVTRGFSNDRDCLTGIYL